ncbi:MAG: NAD-dependent epimerase/dehydratase family protein [Actinobacteria bacterium]|nr:NAD-dependent epimerase/dehydratase family protein [Actinomycetota bacterium]
MSVVAITGSSGYIGSRIEHFLEDEDKVSRVVGVDISPPAEPFGKTRYHRMDIRDPALVSLFRRENVEKVIHLAFVVNPIHNTTVMHDININGFTNVLAATVACGARHLIAASSSTAFGAFEDNPEWLAENDTPRRQPNFTYASDKYEMETLAVSFIARHPEIKVAVIRPCIVYGLHVDNYLSRFIIRLPFVPAVGDARPEMQFVHEDDVAEVFLRVLGKEASGYFHAAGDGTVNLEEIARMSGKRVIGFPPGFIYPSLDLLYRLRAPLIEGPSGMLDFIRYRWTISDAETRRVLGLGRFRSSRDVLRLMLESQGVDSGV